MFIIPAAATIRPDPEVSNAKPKLPRFASIGLSFGERGRGARYCSGNARIVQERGALVDGVSLRRSLRHAGRRIASPRPNSPERIANPALDPTDAVLRSLWRGWSLRHCGEFSIRQSDSKSARSSLLISAPHSRRIFRMNPGTRRAPPTVGKPRRRLDQVAIGPRFTAKLAVAANARRLNDPRDCWGRLAQFLPAQDIGRQIPRRRLSVSDRSLRHGRPPFRRR